MGMVGIVECVALFWAGSLVVIILLHVCGNHPQRQQMVRGCGLPHTASASPFCGEFLGMDVNWRGRHHLLYPLYGSAGRLLGLVTSRATTIRTMEEVGELWIQQTYVTNPFGLVHSIDFVTDLTFPPRRPLPAREGGFGG